jgi:hypothetical protein
MRMLGERFTIAWLMVAVLIAGLMMWGGLVIWPLFSPTIAEQQAEASYRQMKSNRYAIEYAIQMFQQGRNSQTYREKIYQEALISFRANRSTARPLGKSETIDPAKADEAKAFVEEFVKSRIAEDAKSLVDRLEKTRANEQAKLATYQKERARRLRLLGF